MGSAAAFSFYESLTLSQKELADRRAVTRLVFQNAQFSVPDEGPCPFVLRKGQLRGYMTSDEGKEVTLFRLFSGEEGILSPAGVDTELFFEAERDSEILLLPPAVFRQLQSAAPGAAAFSAKVLADQFSQTLMSIERILWTRFDLRLAEFLLEESQLEGSSLLELTHEQIASHLGTAREVVTRTLRRFQRDGLVELGRGWLKIIDQTGLEALLE